jgi:hypothetical protein
MMRLHNEHVIEWVDHNLGRGNSGSPWMKLFLVEFYRNFFWRPGNWEELRLLWVIYVSRG